MKRFFNILLLVVPLLALTGCMKKKCKSEDKKGVMHAGAGIPLSDKKKSMSADGKDLEEFLLDDSHEGSSRKITLSLDTHDEHREISWQEDSQTLGFKPVFFNFDSFAIRQDQKATVAFDINLAKDAIVKGKEIRIDGHSDQHFVNDAYNRAVALHRATKVADEFVSQGVSKDTIKVMGYGADKPVVNLPGQKVQENRRVEVTTLINKVS